MTNGEFAAVLFLVYPFIASGQSQSDTYACGYMTYVDNGLSAYTCYVPGTSFGAFETYTLSCGWQPIYGGITDTSPTAPWSTQQASGVCGPSAAAGIIGGAANCPPVFTATPSGLNLNTSAKNMSYALGFCLATSSQATGMTGCSGVYLCEACPTSIGGGDVCGDNEECVDSCDSAGCCVTSSGGGPGGPDTCDDQDPCANGSPCDYGVCSSNSEAIPAGPNGGSNGGGGNQCPNSQDGQGSLCNGTFCSNGCDSTGCVCAPQGCSAYTNAYGNWICNGTLCQNGCVSNGCGCNPTDPILIDLGGNGFSMTDVKHGVSFDFAGQGNSVLTSWTAQGWNGGWLALDRNGNGRIDNGTELFGNLTPQPETTRGVPGNGFLALAVYDTNHDGVIDAKDPIYSKLVIWIDKNHNGISEPGELIGLAQAGVKSISLKYTPSQWTDANGNTFRYKSAIQDGSGDPITYDVVLSQAVPNKAHTLLTPAGGKQ